MKMIFRKRFSRGVAVTMALLLLLSSLTAGVSAYSFSSGQSVSGIGTIKSSTSKTITSGLQYTNFTFTDSSGNGQTAYTMEFNPSTSNLIPYTYQPKPSYGSTVQNSYNKATAEGYTVYGAINGEFFSMASGNYGTLEGLLVTNGKVVADNENRTNPDAQEPTSTNRQVVLAIDKDGNFNLVESRTAYHFYVNGTECGDSIIGSINKRYNGSTWWDPLCYFDKNAGGTTYTVSSCPGIEVVFNKTDNTELMIGSTLQGTVASINTNTYGTSFNDDQFVLFAQNTSANYSYLSSLSVGDEVQISVEETVESSKEIMENAISVTSANYPIVMNGTDNVDNIAYKASDIGGATVHPQRTAIGIKADGTYVYFCSAGRGTSSENTYGLTLHQLAETMIALGCVTAVNLDGGGSSTMMAGNTKVYSAGDRAVGSSVLIVARDSAVQSTTEKELLSSKVSQASSTSYGADQAALVNSIVSEAKSVLSDSNAMTGNYKRLYMKLQEAMGEVQSVTPKTYISLDASDWSAGSSTIQIANSSSGALELNNTDGLWPTAVYSCSVTVSPTDTLYYDMTINGGASILLKANGVSTTINAAIAPKNIDSGSGDIQGSGRTYTGALKLSELGLPSDMFNADGSLTLTSITIFVTGSAGSGSKTTIREFYFASAYSSGDVNGDGRKDSTDARLVLRYQLGKASFTAEQQAAADYNGDGVIDSSDARALLRVDTTTA